jgi:predicted GIY-YIG superfamily endonuclease
LFIGANGCYTTRVTKFDQKFGSQLLSEVPSCPGVYRFCDADGVVLYVGKAKNLRRRLSNYRNAGRKRVHRKMRTLVREAALLRFEVCDSEHAALLREGELIRELKPQYNVDGAFAFLYPSWGVGYVNRTLLLCFAALDLRWYGCFRSRPRAKLAFNALVDMLSLIAHREKGTRLPAHPRIKGSQLAGLRQVPSAIVALLEPFLAGEHMKLPGHLARLLLDKPRALNSAAEVQAQLKSLARFFEADTARLRAARELLGVEGYHVSQEERDALFIRAAASLAEGLQTSA